jgi:flagellar protein FliO/FliZ
MNSAADIVSSGLKILFSLVVVLAGLLVLFYTAKRILKNSAAGINGGGVVKVLGSTCIGFKRYISLIDIPGCILVIGICGDSMSLLSKIEDRDMIDQIRERTKSSPAFLSHLKKASDNAGFQG